MVKRIQQIIIFFGISMLWMSMLPSFAYIQGSGIPSAAGIMSIFTGNSKMIPRRWRLPRIIYNSQIGTLSALDQMKQKNVDFVLTLGPRSKKELKRYHAIQFPIGIGGMVPIVNIVGVRSGMLNLDGSILYGILTGKIEFWDDPQILSINPSLHLPHQQIMLVYPYPGSSYSFILSHYLRSINKKWGNNKVGYKILWRNAGIASTTFSIKSLLNIVWQVKALPNSLGFVDYYFINDLFLGGYGKNITLVNMSNLDNRIVRPGYPTFRAAALKGKFNAKDNFITYIDHQSGYMSWPISEMIYVIIPIDNKQSSLTISFFMWLLKSSRPYLWKHFGYAALPPFTVNKINAGVVETIIQHNKEKPKKPIILRRYIVGDQYYYSVINALPKQKPVKTTVSKGKKNSKNTKYKKRSTGQPYSIKHSSRRRLPNTRSTIPYASPGRTSGPARLVKGVKKPTTSQSSRNTNTNTRRTAPQQQRRTNTNTNTRRPAPQQQRRTNTNTNTRRTAPQQQRRTNTNTNTRRTAPQQQRRTNTNTNTRRTAPQQQRRTNTNTNTRRPAPQQQRRTNTNTNTRRTAPQQQRRTNTNTNTRRTAPQQQRRTNTNTNTRRTAPQQQRRTNTNTNTRRTAPQQQRRTNTNTNTRRPASQ